MLMFNSISFISIIVLLIFNACKTNQSASSQAEQQPTQMTAPTRVLTYTYEIVKTYPHDPAAFTQGLVFHQGLLYESTGLNGFSSLRQVELETGRVLKKVDVPQQFFAEGLTLFNGHLYQLTWQSQIGFIYTLDSFNLLNSFSYTGEGWGLTHNSHSLIMTNGSSQIRFLNPDTFEVQRVINVEDNGRPITQLNEIEYIKGEIYANIWQTDRIARIDPNNGRVTAWINLSGLLSPEDRARGVDVLNGIAYDETTDRLFVTGKLWPKLFEIRLKLRRNQVSR
jgi:glutamine cyclotransferase